jgi:uncharacterized protein (TIGR02147 family)
LAQESCDNYREKLLKILSDRRKTSPRLTQSYFAERAGIQRTYLSHVLAGRADLNADQLFSLCEVLGLSGMARDELSLLLEIERCGIASRRQMLMQKLQQLREDSMRSENFLSNKTSRANISEQYYQDPFMPAVHMMLLIKRFQSRPARISDALGIPPSRLAQILNGLREMGIISGDENEPMVNLPNLHLAEKHPLSRVHATEMRQLAIHRRMVSDDPRELYFTASFTADAQTLAAIKAQLLSSIGTISNNVAKAPSDEVAQLNIDLFALGQDWSPG